MEHVVFYPSVEGGSAFKRVNSLDEAVAFVEHLRNSENITDFSVHTLTPVPLSFRAYYHVEVPNEDGVSVTEPAASAEPVAEPVAEREAVASDAPETAADDAPVATDGEPVDAPAAVADSTPDAVTVPAQAEAPAADAADDVTMAPVEAVDDDRSAEWVAEAPVVELPVEAPAVAPVEAPVVAAGPFAEAPPVTPASNEDVVPVPTGKRSMGFFAR